MIRTSEPRDFDARMAERRLRGARTFGDSDAPRAPKTPDRPFRSPLGWLLAVILGVVLALLGALAVIVVPAGLDCRAQSTRGFFAGDDVTACLARSVPAQFRTFEERLRRVILHSGQ